MSAARVPALRRAGPFLLALVVAVGLVAAPPAATPVRAATPDLTIVTKARYDVQPDKRRVAVRVDMTLRNRLKDTSTRRFYFDQAFLAVLPGTTNHKVSWSGTGTPKVRIARRTKDYTLLRIDLPQRLYSGKSATYRLTFDMKDTGGAATRDVRVGESLASFPVWAFATDSTPGSSVTVIFPKGFTIDVEVGDLPEPTVEEDGRIVYRTGELAKPLDFFAYFLADRPSAYEERRVTTAVGTAPVELVIRAWPDDPEWSERVGGLFERALPELGELIGLPWPRDDGLVVQEAVSRATGGYAGLFDPTTGAVDVAYYADDFVVLHEAAHAWFNGQLLADRWANEAFASYYALKAASALEVSASGDELTEQLVEARIPLNAWGAVGREATATEDYAYAATLALARLIAERAGQDGLRSVWQAAAEGIGAYQPEDAPIVERVTGPPDWRGLLDLFEERTGAEYEDLWREWVLRDRDLPLLEDRAEARATYEATLAEAGDWSLPRPIRDALRAWQFDDAERLLDEAATVLAARDELATTAAAAGLTPPGTLEDAFEDDDGFADAMAEIAAQRETIARITEAAAARPVEDDPFVQLGLWDIDPAEDLEAARAAYAGGDLQGAVTAADEARSAWSDARDVGTRRAVSIGGVTLALLLLVAVVVATLIGRRRRGREGFAAQPDAAVRPSDTDPAG